ncbi:MAG TPA: hypothetical protein EYM95_16075 [Candidatus Obscuribacterales bacterium]|jgi:hypothetical protein|nr:hypothetical protein [Candidatus Obscuribacterales bacterium]
MTQSLKKKFHKFTTYLRVRDPEDERSAGRFVSGSAETEFEILVDLTTITAVQPQAIFSAVFPDSHFLGSRVYLFGVPGVNYIAVKENLQQMEEILKRV